MRSRNRDIQANSRAGREMSESGQHLIAMRCSIILLVKQTPFATTENEQYPVTPQLVYQHEETLHSSACERLEALKRDVMPQGFSLHSL
jgi:hypothetical protein